VTEISTPSFYGNPTGLSDRFRRESPGLKLGQYVTGKVIEMIDDRRVLLLLDGRPITVETRIPLRAGREGVFLVQALEPQILLKPLPAEGGRIFQGERWLAEVLKSASPEAALARAQLVDLTQFPPGRDGALAGTGRGLVELWDALAPSRLVNLAPADLLALISRSGLFFESKLRRLIETGRADLFAEVLNGDVKGLLFKLKALLEARQSIPEDSGGPAISELLKKINNCLARIEATQEMNSSPSGAGERQAFTLPFWFQGELNFVDLRFDCPPQERSTGGEGLSVLFLLNLPGWGRILIEARITGKKIYGRLLLPTEEVAAFFDRSLGDLEGRLRTLGFDPLFKAASLRPEEMLDEFLGGIGRDERFLNIVI